MLTKRIILALLPFIFWLSSNDVTAKPKLSFTFAAYMPGYYSTYCDSVISTSKSKGFNTVTLVPAFTIDANGNFNSLVGKGEIYNCLDIALKHEMHVNYKPHIEHISITTGGNVWRATIDFTPNENYIYVLFNEFIEWQNKNIRDIRENNIQISTVFTAELERATANHPREFKNMVALLRTKLLPEVSISMNPNWYPAYDPEPQNCDAFNDLIRTFDYISPSFYGDYSNYTNKLQFDEHMKKILGYLTRKNKASLCLVNAYNEKNIALGEFAIGGDIQATYKNEPPKNKERYIEERYAIYSNLIDWMKNRANNVPYVNIWTVGVFSPIDIGYLNQKTIADERITDLFKSL